MVQKHDSRGRRLPAERRQNYWGKERILKGLRRYYEENGQWPTSFEIDKADYLPTSRQIQRKYGGLRKLRAELDIESPVDFRKGRIRSKQMEKLLARGKEFENAVWRDMSERFGEVFVHREKPLSAGGHIRADFVIYAQNKTIAVDVFSPTSIESMKRNLQIKIRTYLPLSSRVPLYLVYPDDAVPSSEMKRHLTMKDQDIPDSWHVVTYSEFQKATLAFEPLRDPTGYVPLRFYDIDGSAA